MSPSFPSKVVGFLLLVVTVGVASCQALVVAPPETPPAVTGPAGED
jgi:hypothetical protein